MTEPLSFPIVALSDWPLIAPVMSEEFRNAMPESPEQSTFQGVYDGEKLVGWLHVEHLYHFNCAYLDVGYRQSGLGLRLIQEAASRIPVGESAIWITDRKVNAIARRLKWRYLGDYRVYRKDV